MNLSVDIRLDQDGRPSVDPMDVTRFTQGMLYKMVLERTGNGTSTSGADVKEMTKLLDSMNQTALMTRKLDQEEKGLVNGAALIETFKQFELMSRGQNVYNPDNVKRDNDPYAGLTLPDIDVNHAELAQGEQVLNADDFIPEE